MSELSEAAIEYAKRGWKVHPLRVGEKFPATEHGYKDATTDLEQIEAWWTRNPNYNIGLATGQTFDAIDIDSKEAFDRFHDYLGTQGLEKYVHNMIVATPRGQHWYFLPTGQTCKVDLIKGVDFRGAGGYVVAPPSFIQERRLHYRWVTDPNGDLLPAPQPMKDLIGYRNRPKKEGPVARFHTTDTPTGYGVAAIAGAVNTLMATKEGNRNDILNREAYSLYRAVASAQLPEAFVDETLTNLARYMGLEEVEVQRTLRSAKEAGFLSPRSLDTL